jgi:membrane protein DedA with SNARE-associated domain
MTNAATAVALAAATLASEDLAALGAAVLAADGRIELWVAILAVTAGVYAGDLLLFAGGRASARVVNWRQWIARRWGHEELDRLARALDRRLAIVVVGSRFIPGSRLPMYVAAGMLSRRPVAFCLWTLVAVVTWTPLLVSGVWWIGETFETSARSYFRWTPALAALVFFHVAMRALSKRSAR